MDPQSFDDMRSGCYDIHDRVKDMNANGMLGSMCFPSFPQFCGQLFARTAANDEPTSRTRSCSAYNDWHIDVVVRRVPRPFHPAVDPDDVGPRARWRPRCGGSPRRAATRSRSPRTRCTSGTRASTRATGTRSSPPCEELDTVVCVHIGSSSKMVITAPRRADGRAHHAVADQHRAGGGRLRVVATCRRSSRKLKYALSEGGIGWIPYFRERIDYTYDRHRFWTGQDMGDRLPSQVFDEQVVVLLDRRPGRCRDAAQDERRHGLLGMRLPALRLHVAAVAGAVLEADAGRELRRTRTSRRSRTRTRCGSSTTTRSRCSADARTAPSARCARRPKAGTSASWHGASRRSGTGAMDLLKMAAGRE